MVSGSRDNKIIFWDTKTTQILKTIMIGRNLVCGILRCEIKKNLSSSFSYRLQMLNGHMMETFIAQTGEDKEPKYMNKYIV